MSVKVPNVLMFYFRAMRSYLSFRDRDENVTVSLMTDIDSLEAEVRQLEQAWIHSLLSSDHCHCHSSVNQLSANCAGDEAAVSASQCRQLSNMTPHVAELSLVETDMSLRQGLNSGCQRSVDHRTMENNTARCTRQESVGLQSDDSDSRVVEHVTVETNTSVNVCQQFVMSANTDRAFFTDTLHSSHCQLCCGKLQQLLNACLSLSLRTSQQHAD